MRCIVDLLFVEAYDLVIGELKDIDTAKSRHESVSPSPYIITPFMCTVYKVIVKMENEVSNPARVKCIIWEDAKRIAQESMKEEEK